MSVDINVLLREHMEQQPYETKCAVCGQTLITNIDRIDGDMDLYIEVEPCKTCIDNAIKEQTE